MVYSEPRIRQAGDTSLLIEWADEINDDVNDRVHAFARLLQGQARPGILDLIPAYTSLVVTVDPKRVTAREMRGWLEERLGQPLPTHGGEAREIEIPVRYGGEFGPDLGFVAKRSGLTEAQVVELHTGVLYRVYLIGFAPGFAYLGSVPVQIAAPRLEEPRTHVPAGSVGIAGRQTGIYPMALPGGWRLIGRTDVRLFDPAMDPPSLLRPGDRVRFVAV